MVGLGIKNHSPGLLRYDVGQKQVAQPPRASCFDDGEPKCHRREHAIFAGA